MQDGAREGTAASFAMPGAENALVPTIMAQSVKWVSIIDGTLSCVSVGAVRGRRTRSPFRIDTLPDRSGVNRGWTKRYTTYNSHTFSPTVEVCDLHTFSFELGLYECRTRAFPIHDFLCGACGHEQKATHTNRRDRQCARSASASGDSLPRSYVELLLTVLHIARLM